nr:MAG TPA: hypothetical protein [Caudoviricetes sp.]
MLIKFIGQDDVPPIKTISESAPWRTKRRRSR